MRQRDPSLNTARRAAILDAAATCFVRRGFDATSMKDICAVAGMSPGTLYHYFPSKAAIVTGIIEAERDVTAGILADLAEAPDIRAGLTRALRQVLAQATPEALRLRAEVAAEILRNNALRDLARRTEAEATRLLAERIAAAQAAGQVGAEIEPAATAVAILAVVEGLLWRAGLFGNEATPGPDAAVLRLLGPGSAP
jgi:AcrR family transcriptional regulator